MVDVADWQYSPDPFLVSRIEEMVLTMLRHTAYGESSWTVKELMTAFADESVSEGEEHSTAFLMRQAFSPERYAEVKALSWEGFECLIWRALFHLVLQDRIKAVYHGDCLTAEKVHFRFKNQGINQ